MNFVSKNLVICHVNLNSIVNKINYVINLVETHAIDILGISESWLSSEIVSAGISIPGFNLIRNDSFSKSRIHGVCIYVKCHINFSEVNLTFNNVISLFLNDFKLQVVLIYRPPSYTDECNSKIVNLLYDICVKYESVILGDFNLPGIKWPNIS